MPGDGNDERDGESALSVQKPLRQCFRVIHQGAIYSKAGFVRTLPRTGQKKAGKRRPPLPGPV